MVFIVLVWSGMQIYKMKGKSQKKYINEPLIFSLYSLVLVIGFDLKNDEWF